jgi:phosphonate transport system substrate-binding protein
MNRRNFVGGFAACGIDSSALAQVIGASGSVASSAAAPTSGSRKRASVNATTSPPLVFGLITPRNSEQTLKNWTPLIDRLVTASGVRIEAKTYGSGSELTQDFVQGRIDLAWAGNSSALDIVESGAGNVFASIVVQGKTAYRSLLITHRDSPVRSLDDVHRQGAALVFSDGDPKSTSGHIVPLYYAFVKRGINEPAKLFKEMRRGNHESNLLAVSKRDVDIATSNTSELDNFRLSNPALGALVRPIWESPDIPESPLLWRETLPLPLKNRIQRVLTELGASEVERRCYGTSTKSVHFVARTIAS